MVYLLWQNIGEIHGLGIVPGAHDLHATDVGEVVRDDLTQLGEMPAVPVQKQNLTLNTVNSCQYFNSKIDNEQNIRLS